MDPIDNDAKSIIKKVLGDVSKTSATKQLILGTATGWCTGYLGMKVGKVTALAVGGGIILLQIANHNGYVKINWNKIFKKMDKISDKVEENITGQGPNWMDKVERYVDRKIDKADDLIRNRQQKAKSWCQSASGNTHFTIKEIHIFLVSFVAGLAIGIGTA